MAVSTATAHTFPVPVPAPTQSNSTMFSSITPLNSVSTPRIRILLSPYMSPYVIPLHKVETWELLLSTLGELFGDAVKESTIKVADSQGNGIHKDAWADLVEPEMTVVVDIGNREERGALKGFWRKQTAFEGGTLKELGWNEDKMEIQADVKRMQEIQKHITEYSLKGSRGERTIEKRETVMMFNGKKGHRRRSKTDLESMTAGQNREETEIRPTESRKRTRRKEIATWISSHLNSAQNKPQMEISAPFQFESSPSPPIKGAISTMQQGGFTSHLATNALGGRSYITPEVTLPSRRGITPPPTLLIPPPKFSDGKVSYVATPSGAISNRPIQGVNGKESSVKGKLSLKTFISRASASNEGSGKGKEVGGRHHKNESEPIPGQGDDNKKDIKAPLAFPMLPSRGAKVVAMGKTPTSPLAASLNMVMRKLGKGDSSIAKLRTKERETPNQREHKGGEEKEKEKEKEEKEEKGEKVEKKEEEKGRENGYGLNPLEANFYDGFDFSWGAFTAGHLTAEPELICDVAGSNAPITGKGSRVSGNDQPKNDFGTINRTAFDTSDVSNPSRTATITTIKTTVTSNSGLSTPITSPSEYTPTPVSPLALASTTPTNNKASTAKKSSLPPIDKFKPLPKLPYKFSTFPAPSPPRPPLIMKPASNSALGDRSTVNKHTPTKPTSAHILSKESISSRIVPFNELDRKLGEDNVPQKEETQQHKRIRSSTSQTHLRNISTFESSMSVTTTPRPRTTLGTEVSTVASEFQFPLPRKTGVTPTVTSTGTATMVKVRAGQVGKSGVKKVELGGAGGSTRTINRSGSVTRRRGEGPTVGTVESQISAQRPPLSQAAEGKAMGGYI